MHADRLEEQATRHRGGDLGVLLPETREATIARGFWRTRGADLIRTVAPLVRFVRAGDLDLRVHLIGDAKAVVELLTLVHRRGRRRHVEPLVDLERVGVGEDASLALDRIKARR